MFRTKQGCLEPGRNVQNQRVLFRTKQGCSGSNRGVFLKYLHITQSGCKDIRVAKTHFLFPSIFLKYYSLCPTLVNRWCSELVLLWYRDQSILRVFLSKLFVCFRFKHMIIQNFIWFINSKFYSVNSRF